MIYLACPYTHPEPEIRQKRFRLATIAAAHLLEKGNIVLSPITMTHPMDIIMAAEGETLGSDFWVQFDKAMMDACNEMVVLKLEGWQESQGVKNEISYFKANRKPITFLAEQEINTPPKILRQFNKYI